MTDDALPSSGAGATARDQSSAAGDDKEQGMPLDLQSARVEANRAMLAALRVAEGGQCAEGASASAPVKDAVHPSQIGPSVEDLFLDWCEPMTGSSMLPFRGVGAPPLSASHPLVVQRERRARVLMRPLLCNLDGSLCLREPGAMEDLEAVARAAMKRHRLHQMIRGESAAEGAAPGNNGSAPRGGGKGAMGGASMPTEQAVPAD